MFEFKTIIYKNQKKKKIEREIERYRNKTVYKFSFPLIFMGNIFG